MEFTGLSVHRMDGWIGGLMRAFCFIHDFTGVVLVELYVGMERVFIHRSFYCYLVSSCFIIRRDERPWKISVERIHVYIVV